VTGSDAAIPYYTDAAQIFRDVARRFLARRALVWGEQVATSYERLDRLSNQVARLFLARGVKKRDAICLCLEKSELAYASILGCLKIGSPYFVVDPTNPAARTRAMLQHCQPALAVIEPSVDASPFECPTIVADARQVAYREFADDPVELDWSIDGSDPAYIMFTSGSTGVPKGVTISQSNLVSFIGWSQHQLGTRPDDVFTGVNPLFFDNSVFDFYSSVFAGAALLPLDAATTRDPAKVVSRIEQFGATIYFSVPSLLVYLQTLKLITPSSFPCLRKILFGGEGYPKPMLGRLLKTVGDRIALYNVYGPTECTCICSVYSVSEADLVDPSGYAPLGHLLPGFSGVIIDGAGHAVADGEVGELCLGGPCVGLGYYNDPAQTAAAFVQNPTHDRFNDRVYRTGDLVRRDPVDGRLYFIGRGDSQIKHQGYRIELGEVEHALAAVGGVDEAAAVYTAKGMSGHIVGVVASRSGVAPAAVKRAVQQMLPTYMVPERVVVVEQLLKNANGKIDRHAIRASIERTEA
jgi:D-alanine--poly(phosphoribitol) ligase subunit 1